MKSLSDIQSTRKLYHLIKSRIKSKKISFILERIVIFLLVLVYRFKILFSKKNNKIQEISKIQDYNEPDMEENRKMIQINNDLCYDVSILVPVYNVELYLEQCIQSLIGQKTNCKYEIIFVNDGSTDKSKEILKKYKEVKNVRIITQENKGLAETRNVLLENASGKYIFFVDSDDILQDNAIEKMFNEAIKNDYDIVQCSYYKFNEQATYYIEFDERNIINSKYLNMQLPGFAWGKLIKVELFNNKRFPTGYLYEDTIIPFLIFSECKKIKIISDCFYGYRINANGIVRKSKSSVRCCDTAYIFDQILYQMNVNNIKIDYEVYKFILNCQFSYVTYGRIKDMDEQIQRFVFFKLCTYIDEIKSELNKNENIITQNLDKSLKTKDFELWKLSSKIINLCN